MISGEPDMQTQSRCVAWRGVKQAKRGPCVWGSPTSGDERIYSNFEIFEKEKNF